MITDGAAIDGLPKVRNHMSTCNGTAFADAKAFTGATLAQLRSSPSQETAFNFPILACAW
jgi:hypothetical protein